MGDVLLGAQAACESVEVASADMAFTSKNSE